MPIVKETIERKCRATNLIKHEGKWLCMYTVYIRKKGFNNIKSVHFIR